MRKMKQTIKTLTLLLTAAIVFGTMSCEVGLGSSVDTERPALEITYPPKGAVIRDTFVLAGTVSDDVGVKSMKVTLTHKTLKTLESKVYSTEKGEVKLDSVSDWRKGTTWSVNIGKKDTGSTLYNGWDLPDGEYFIDVEAFDVESSTTTRSSIKIDNTAPVFLLENITSLGSVQVDDKISTLGQKINLRGKLQDDNGISKIYFDVYDENKTFIGSSSVDYKQSNDIILAQYKTKGSATTDEEKLLAENYNLIYFGHKEYRDEDTIPVTNPPIKTRYFSVYLTDTAREYNDVSIENGKEGGNKTEKIYMNTTDFGSEGINIDDLSAYAKQLTSNPSLDATLKNLEGSSIIQTSVPNNFNNYAKVKINPEISPKWSVSAYAIKIDNTGKDFPECYISDSGVPALINFQSGNDSVAFRESDIRIILATLTEKITGDYTALVETDENKLRTAKVGENENVIVLKDYNEGSTEAKTLWNPNFLFKNGELKVPNRYRIMIFGKDVNGVDFCEDNGSMYGIKACRTGNATEIKFNTENDKWIGPKDESFDLEFNVDSKGENISAGYPQVTVIVLDKENNKISEIENSNFKWIDKDGNDISSFKGDTNKVTLKNAAGGNLPMPQEGQKYIYQISVKVNTDSGLTSQSYYNINVDRKAPIIKAGNPSPYIYEESKVKLNGIENVSVEFEDDKGVDKAYYKASWQSEYTEIGLTENEDKKTGIISLDTVTPNITDNTDVTLKVKAVDVFGNEKEETYSFTVDQKTDQPKLELGLSIGSGVTYSTNNINLSTTQISGNVTDDDGNSDIEIKITDKNDNLIRDFVKISENTSGTFRFKLSDKFNNTSLLTKDGKYKLYFRATDKTGSGYTNSKYITPNPYLVLVDGTDPIFGDTVTVKSDGKTLDEDAQNKVYYVKKGKSAEVTVRLTEGNLSEVKVNNSSDNITKTLDANSTTEWTVKYTWTPSASETSGRKDVKFVATDESSKSSDKTIYIYYDADEPEITNVKLNPIIDSYKTYSNVVNGIVTLTADVKDNDQISEIEVSAKDKNNKEGIPEATKKISANVLSKTGVKINTTELADGTLTVTVKATD
ncbi:MAG: hypothetical protein HUK25_10695, partial [Treponema sp.]|nr:hypothetical protein [Treponema sp.]